MPEPIEQKAESELSILQKQIKSIENKILHLEEAIQNTSDPEILQMLKETIMERKTKLKAVKVTINEKSEEGAESGERKRDFLDDLI